MLLRKLDNILRRDVAQYPLNLLGVHPPASGDNLASNILSNGSSAVKAQEQRSLELGLRTLDLGVRDGLRDAGPLTEREVDEIVDLGELVGDEVDTPETGVRVGGREGHEGLGEIVLVHKGREARAEVGSVAHGAVPVANDGLGDESGEVVGRLPRDTLDGNGNVGGVHGVVTETDLRADEVGLGAAGSTNELGLGGGLELAKVLLGELDEGLVGNATSADKDHAVRLVVVGDVLGEVVLLDGEDVLAGAEDGAAESLALEGGSVKVVEDNLLNLLVNLLLLAENDVPLALDGGLLELGVLEDIGKNLDSLGGIVLERPGKVDCVLALPNPSALRPSESISNPYRSVRIQVSAHVLNLELELLLCPALGALEGEMLKEVRNTVRLVGLSPAARIDPDTARRSLRIGRVLGRDLLRVSQGPAFVVSRPPLGLTVKPFLRVVVWVTWPGTFVGLGADVSATAAKPLLSAGVRLRRALVRPNLATLAAAAIAGRW